MALTKADLEEVLKKLKEERITEIQEIKDSFIESVRAEMKSQLSVFKAEVKTQIDEIRQEVNERVTGVEDRQSELSDVNSILDCRIDKLEEELHLMKNLLRV